MTREETIAYITEWLKDEYALNDKDRVALNMAIHALEKIPKYRKKYKRWKRKALERQTGEWRHYENMLTCSQCKAEFYDEIMYYCGDDVPRFCPNCGAEMRGVE